MRHVDDGTLNAWLDGALPPGDAASVAVHLEHCGECRSRLGQAEHWRHAADKLLASAAPADLAAPPFQHVLERASVYPPAALRPVTPYHPGEPLRAFPAWATVAWAATILLALAVGYYAGEVYRPARQMRGESGRLQAAAPPQATPASAASGVASAPEKKVPPPPALTPLNIPAPTAAVPQHYAPIFPASPAPAPGAERPLPEARARLAAREADAQAGDIAGGRAAAAASPAAEAAVAGAAAPPAEPARAPGAKTFLQAPSALDLAGKATASTATPATVPPATAGAVQQRTAAHPSNVAMKRADSAAAVQADARIFSMNDEVAPTFTPYTVPPELLNREAVRLALVRFYPTMERAAGVEGRTLLWALVDTAGKVKRTQLKSSSGVPSLDLAAQQVAAVMRFSPALNRDARVEVWIQLPVVFKATP